MRRRDDEAAWRRIDAARLALLAEVPEIADVRQRVLAAIALLTPERDEPRPRDLALAALAAGLSAATLFALAAGGALPWRDAWAGLSGLLAGAANVGSALAGAALDAARAMLGLVATLAGAARPAADLAARLEPAFAVAVGLGYAAMACTILFVLARDLRGPARAILED